MCEENAAEYRSLSKEQLDELVIYLQRRMMPLAGKSLYSVKQYGKINSKFYLWDFQRYNFLLRTGSNLNKKVNLN